MSEPVSRRRFLAGTGAACATVTTGRVPSRIRATGLGDSDDRQGSGNLGDLEAFVDRQVQTGLDEHDVGGATVSVVHDGEVALAKGYGHVVLNESEPVVADETLFRIASISKAITWTAAMGLVDRGAVDPHAPAREALESVSIPQTYDEPITLAHLATHTPGFVQRSGGEIARDIDRVRPLTENLNEHKPIRFRPPGEIPNYTNYAAALAGQLVADVAGTSFERYVETDLFEPLGMDRSTFAPLPDGLVGGSSESHTDEVNWYSQVPPASGMSATATDMVQFMLAHLNGGAVDGNRILSPEAVDAMHRQWFTPHERLDGMAFGLQRRKRDDVLVLRHSGGVPRFASDLLLIPELDLGLFVSYHSGSAFDAKAAFVDAFLDRYAPVGEPRLTPDGRPTYADAIEGQYRSIKVTERPTHGKLPWALFSTRAIDVRFEADGTLITDTGGDTDRWIEVEPLVFRRVDGEETLAFREDDGAITHLFREGSITAFEPVSWYETMGVQARLAAITALVVLSGAVGWPLGTVRRWYRGGPSLSGGPRRARWVAGAVPGCLLAFVASAVVLVAIGALNRPPPWLDLVFVLPIASAVATIWAGVYAVRSWREAYWNFPVRVHYTAVVCAATVLLWMLYYWNLLGLRL
jgi:CubicO group peptidase (beta-lactamase class C family)